MTRRTTWKDRGGLKAIVFFVVALSSIASNTSRVDAGLFDSTAVPWRTDLATAQIEAKEKDLVLWLQFTGPWCPNCRRMERGAFAHSTVVGLARDKFVPIKLRSDEYEALALNLGLTVLPSTVLVRPNGEVIAKQEGYVDTTEFYAFLQDTLIREGRSGPQIAKSVKPASPTPSAIALASYCPVTLVETHKLVAGRPEIASHFQGLEYRFASIEARETFRRRPEQYVPVNKGASPVAQVDQGEKRQGDPRWAITFKGRLFLCSELYERDLFLLNPERYSHVDEMGRANLGDHRGLWALTRPAVHHSVPEYDRTLQTEPLQLHALRSPVASLRR